MADESDPRLEFVYREALRGITQQEAAVESLHNRAATLIFAASFASSLLGSKALADGLNGWDWTAVALLFTIGALTVVMLWPYYGLTFRFDPEALLTEHVDRGATMDGLHRDLALQLKADFAANGAVVHRLRVSAQIALVLLLAEIVVWMFSIAGV